LEDPKEKHIHKYKYHVCNSGTVWGDGGGGRRKENDREWIILKCIESVRRRHNKAHWKLLNDGIGGKG
jgi:hypothetical protein